MHAQVQLSNGVVFVLRNVVLLNFRRTNQNLAPGVDFLVPCLPGQQAILEFEHSVIMQSKYLATNPRQNHLCFTTTSHRCWRVVKHHSGTSLVLSSRLKVASLVLISC